MKTVKQITRKALCLMISALLLTTSSPIQSFAEVNKPILELTTSELYEIIGEINRGLPYTNPKTEELMKRIYKDDYVRPENIWKKITGFSGGENLELFYYGEGYIAEKTDVYMINSAGVTSIFSKETFAELVPISNNNGWYYREPLTYGVLTDPILLDGKMQNAGNRSC